VKRIYLLLVFLFASFFTPNKTYAYNPVTASYKVTYEVSENSDTLATFNVILKNRDNKYYADSYKLKFGFENISNIKGYDPDGPLNLELQKTNNGQEINAAFNKRVFGINKQLPFTISFVTKDIAKKHGNIWEINVPGISDPNEFSSFDVSIKVPQSFGEISYVKPAINNSDLKFTKEQIGKSGISIAFGNVQNYKFNLFYHLKNPSLFPVKTEIAIPPSTNYQNISIEDISPKPINVIKDADGNWLAQYKLSTSQKMDVTVKGMAEIFLYPKKELLTAEKEKLYLKEQKYWEKNEKIKKLANDLKTPAAIYDYVVNALKYDFSKAADGKPRLGSKNTLDNPSSAVCLEFTDLFIALSRAAGVPAREINGFAYTENDKQRPLSLIKDVLHAWPEYYDKDLQTWIMVDPTWGNTTNGIDYFNILDLNHFTFVIRGTDSTYPVPAGGYKIQNAKNGKDVFVDFMTEEINQTPTQLEVSSFFSDKSTSALPIQGYIIFKNNGQSIYPKEKVLIESDYLLPRKTLTTVDEIPPFGFLKIPVSFENTNILTNRTTTVKITAGNKSITNEVKISLFSFKNFNLILGGILSVITAIVLFVFAARTRSLFFSRQK